MTHEDSIVDEVVQFTLASSQMEKVRAYVQRGRQYAHLTAKELHVLFVQVMKSWAANPNGRRERMLYSDVSAEYSMRGQIPPSGSVKHESEIIGKVARGFYALSKDKQREIGREMLQEYVSAQLASN